ncbi:MAG TPA: hypothetical protein DF296_12400 [Candidatus Margulisbacteria bacterium]|nr:MAG: hypothetical protein A2X43_09460 [Candidatus Margulisbacteria bacterium GWD2_39_127]OGI02883.1 MAG: hypothetical protein A2X42_02305 [Candidatus Margulisbacteria bacterium GWF2_38_17]OGI06821.1 MAG: hypothetical protein A2X41_03675 [Candidatus Margulisbacteria bacterium GWE2_39_32]HAR62169.1 hypothetical protein [Candidatus Margulisiibacteriota bacterium]HCT85983.1 hypothetical protein [Candidatus Margulisiibacteriota bacterium]
MCNEIIIFVVFMAMFLGVAYLFYFRSSKKPVTGKAYFRRKKSFHIDFPSGWKKKPSNKPEIIAASTCGNGGSITILSKPLPKDIENFTLGDFSSEQLEIIIKEVFCSIENKYSGAVLHDNGITRINNKSAIWFLYSYSYNSDFIKMLELVTFCNRKQYTMACAAPAFLFAAYENLFWNTLRSTIFEK